MHETTDRIRRDALRTRKRSHREPSRFEKWAFSEVAMIRVALVLVYLGYLYLALASLRAGVPAFTLTAPEAYTPIWAGLLALAGVNAAVAATSDRWMAWERWSSLAVSALMGAYVGTITILGYVTGDVNRQAVAAGLTIAFILPACRFLWLAAQTGKKRTT